MLRLLIAIVTLAAGPVIADSVPDDALRRLSPGEFEAYSTGRVLTYASPGAQPYGREEYLPGRDVIWSWGDGQCKRGRWFVDLDLICFVYEDGPVGQCWSFFLTDDGLRAQYENDENPTILYEVGQSTEPLSCPAPYLGS